jgi:hypothetical protein
MSNRCKPKHELKGNGTAITMEYELKTRSMDQTLTLLYYYIKRETCKMHGKYLNKSLKTIEPSCPWTSKVSRVGWNEGIYVASSKLPKPITLLYSFIYGEWTTSASSIPLHIFGEGATSCYFRSSSHFNYTLSIRFLYHNIYVYLLNKNISLKIKLKVELQADVEVRICFNIHT